MCSWSWSIWVWLDPSDREAVLINYSPAERLSTTALPTNFGLRSGMQECQTEMYLYPYLYSVFLVFPFVFYTSMAVSKLRSRNDAIGWEDLGSRDGKWLLVTLASQWWQSSRRKRGHVLPSDNWQFADHDYLLSSTSDKTTGIGGTTDGKLGHCLELVSSCPRPVPRPRQDVGGIYCQLKPTF